MVLTTTRPVTLVDNTPTQVIFGGLVHGGYSLRTNIPGVNPEAIGFAAYNKYICTGGTVESALNPVADNKFDGPVEKCVSCDAGRHLDGGPCTVNVCTYGTPDPEEATKTSSGQNCVSCDSEYYLKGDQCKVICKNGTPDVSSPDRCASCDAGFYLGGGICNPYPGGQPSLIGSSEQVFESNGLSDGNDWFVDGHSFIVDQAGTLHWFGINNPFPPERWKIDYEKPYLGHRKTNSIAGTWTTLPMAIDESAGTRYVGTPYVIWHTESERYAMVVEVKRSGARRLAVYWSTDLNNWQAGPLILSDTLWSGTRDPHIIKGDDNKYWIYVTSTNNNGKKESQILRIRTTDFVTFEAPETVFAIDNGGMETTYIESLLS